jgi:hypothetical protein
MDQRITHQMEAHLLGERSHLIDDPPKEIQLDQRLAADDLRAEAALEVADVADLDIDLGETDYWA